MNLIQLPVGIHLVRLGNWIVNLRNFEFLSFFLVYEEFDVLGIRF